MLRLSATILTVFWFLTVPVGAAVWEYVDLDGFWTTAIETDPVHNRILVCTVEGFFILELPSENWIDLNEDGWIGRTVHSIDWHPTLQPRLITGRENAFFKGYVDYTDDLGENWNYVYGSNGGGVLDIDHDDLYYYACTWSDIAPGEFMRSADGGVSWNLIAGTGHFNMTGLAINPSDGTVFMSGDGLVTRSVDQGMNWSSAAGDLPVCCGIYCIDITPQLEILVGNDLGVYRTSDTITWTQVLPNACRNLASYPESGGPIAAVTFDDRVFVSRDGGSSWIDETGNLPGTPVDVTFSTHHQAIYVSTAQHGVYRVEHFLTGKPKQNYTLPRLNLRDITP